MSTFHTEHEMCYHCKMMRHTSIVFNSRAFNTSRFGKGLSRGHQVNANVANDLGSDCNFTSKGNNHFGDKTGVKSSFLNGNSYTTVRRHSYWIGPPGPWNLLVRAFFASFDFADQNNRVACTDMKSHEADTQEWSHLIPSEVLTVYQILQYNFAVFNIIHSVQFCQGTTVSTFHTY